MQRGWRTPPAALARLFKGENRGSRLPCASRSVPRRPARTRRSGCSSRRLRRPPPGQCGGNPDQAPLERARYLASLPNPLSWSSHPRWRDGLASSNRSDGSRAEGWRARTAGTGGPSWKICDDKPAPRIPSPSGCAASAVRCCFSPLRRISRCAAAKQSRLRGRGPSPRRNAARRTVPRRGCKVRPRSKSGCPARPKPLTPATSSWSGSTRARARMAIGVVQRLRPTSGRTTTPPAAPGHRRDGRVQSGSPTGHRLPDQPHDARPVGVAEGQSRSQAARGHEGPRLWRVGADGPAVRVLRHPVRHQAPHPALRRSRCRATPVTPATSLRTGRRTTAQARGASPRWTSPTPRPPS